MNTTSLPNPIVPGVYRIRCGDLVEVTHIDPANNERFPVHGTDKDLGPCSWTAEGSFLPSRDADAMDLVAFVAVAVGDTHGESPSVPDGPTAEPARPLVLLTASDFVATFSDIQARAHSINRANGWWDDRDQYLQSGLPNAHAHTVCSLIGLAHTEFSEAIEAARKHPQSSWSDPATKDTLVRELAGAIVRTMDIAHAFGLPLADAILAELEHNATRGHRHGGKAA